MRATIIVLYVFFTLIFTGCSLSQLSMIKDPRKLPERSPSINAAVIIEDRLSDYEEKKAIECTKPETKHLIGSDDKCGSIKAAMHNFLVTNYYRNIESEYYKNAGNKDSIEHDWPEGLPKTCLAMSGGGLRSAAFNIGVLQGLNEINLLDKIDIISSVSGGSYANLWLTVNKLTSPTEEGNPPSNNILLEEDNDYQNRLEKKIVKFGDLPKMIEITLAGPSMKALFFLESTLSSAFGFTGIFPSGSSIAYGVAIDTVFMRTFNDLGEQATPTFNEIAKVVKANKLPFPIINATAWEDKNPQFFKSTNSQLFYSVFEFTPIRIGSEGFGFHDREDSDLIRVAAASGAAIDNLSYGMQKKMGLLLGNRIPHYISAPRVLGKGRGKNRFTIPPDELQLHDLHLADGGFSDNLGVYSLVKRLCQNIIIVDAGYDPSMTFEDYCKLKGSLKTEMGVTISMPTMEKIFSPPLWDDYRDEKGVLTKEALIEISKSKDFSNEFYRANSMKDNVFSGGIKQIPYWVNGQVRYLEINVTYIKLSLYEFECMKGSYGSIVKEYYDHRKKQFQKKYPNNHNCSHFGEFPNEECIFPHDSTYDQSMSKEQFKAYKALGKAIVTKILSTDNEISRSLNNGTIGFTK